MVDQGDRGIKTAHDVPKIVLAMARQAADVVGSQSDSGGCVSSTEATASVSGVSVMTVLSPFF